ncbi:Six-hairpin glycosidase-like protein [Chytridium lagenaria]|nr:Six-hairpin glycosidase-like protein [Chytridium lagenaria]
MRFSAYAVALVAFVAAMVSAAPLETITAANVPSSGNVVLQSYTYDSQSGFFNRWLFGVSTPPLPTYGSVNNKLTATYSGPAANGYEVWRFLGTPADFGVNSQFYLKYVASGQQQQTSFDNNGSAKLLDPCCSPTSVPPTSTVATTQPPTTTPSTTSPSPTPVTPVVTVVSANAPTNGVPVQVNQYSIGNGVFSGRIYIQNLNFNKAVQVVASTPSGTWGIPSTPSTSLAPPPMVTNSGHSPTPSPVSVLAPSSTSTPPTTTVSRLPSPLPRRGSGFASDITTWFTQAVPSLKRYLFNNISPAGTLKGMVVAAPKVQTSNQFYFFHWIRDASLVMDLVNNLYIDGDLSLEQVLFDHQVLTKNLQGRPALGGLGEAKYEVDGTPFSGPWCRPQKRWSRIAGYFRPSLFIRFAKTYLARGGSFSRIVAMYNSTATGIIKADLDYTVNNSYDTNGCDLWEETRGYHLFTQMMDRKALKEGAEFAAFLGDSASAAAYTRAAAGLDTFVRNYFNPSTQTLMTTLNARQLDSAIALTAIHGYNNDGVYGPLTTVSSTPSTNSPKVSSLNTTLTRNPSVMPLDSPFPPLSVATTVTSTTASPPPSETPGISAPTLVAETYYRAAIDYIKAGKIDVTSLNRPFITGDRPSGLQLGDIAIGSYAKGTPVFNAIIGALQFVADTFVRRAKNHGAADFRFGEQYLRNDGTPTGLGVTDLTWSYSSFLTAWQAREELSKLV